MLLLTRPTDRKTGYRQTDRQTQTPASLPCNTYWANNNRAGFFFSSHSLSPQCPFFIFLRPFFIFLNPQAPPVVYCSDVPSSHLSPLTSSVGGALLSHVLLSSPAYSFSARPTSIVGMGPFRMGQIQDAAVQAQPEHDCAKKKNKKPSCRIK